MGRMKDYTMDADESRISLYALIQYFNLNEGNNERVEYYKSFLHSVLFEMLNDDSRLDSNILNFVNEFLKLNRHIYKST